VREANLEKGYDLYETPCRRGDPHFRNSIFPAYLNAEEEKDCKTILQIFARHIAKTIKVQNSGPRSCRNWLIAAMVTRGRRPTSEEEHAWIGGVVKDNEKKPIYPSEWSAKIKHKYGDDCTLSGDMAYGIAIRDFYQETDSNIGRKTSKEEHAWIGGVVQSNEKKTFIHQNRVQRSSMSWEKIAH
jgi:hypothetical protein